jgi:hypothetical protein
MEWRLLYDHDNKMNIFYFTNQKTESLYERRPKTTY